VDDKVDNAIEERPGEPLSLEVFYSPTISTSM
jgi:hypothetical protein